MYTHPQGLVWVAMFSKNRAHPNHSFVSFSLGIQSKHDDGGKTLNLKTVVQVVDIQSRTSDLQNYST